MNAIKENLKKIPFVLALYERYAETFRIPLDAVRRYKVYHYGNKNKDKKFFLISFELGGKNTMYSKMGIYSLALCFVMPFIDFAVKKGWIPVVDLKGSYVPNLQDEDKLGIENAWEYYYEQPAGISLDEVYQSRYVMNGWYWRHEIKWNDWNSKFSVFAKALENKSLKNMNEIISEEEKELKAWSELIHSYIRLNESMQSRLKVEYNKIFRQGHKVLGVGVRAEFRAGMMKNESMYDDHPRQPTCEELMDIVEKKMETWGCGSIFLSCDDREYLNKFIARFGEKCCYMERKLAHYLKNDRPVIQSEELLIEIKEITRRERTEEYVLETYLLAQCNCFYSCIGGGTQFAYLLNGGKFEHAEIYDKGVYKGLGK